MNPNSSTRSSVAFGVVPVGRSVADGLDPELAIERVERELDQALFGVAFDLGRVLVVVAVMTELVAVGLDLPCRRRETYRSYGPA